MRKQVVDNDPRQEELPRTSIQIEPDTSDQPEYNDSWE
jgi:hypothetical protein